MNLIAWLSIACISYLPRQYSESLRQPPDTSQTPFRHSEAAGIKRTTWSKLFQSDFYHYQLISHHIPPCQCLGHKLEEKKKHLNRFDFVANIHVCVLLVYCVLKYWILRWLDRVWRVLRNCPIDPGYCQDSIAEITIEKPFISLLYSSIEHCFIQLIPFLSMALDWP